MGVFNLIAFLGALVLVAVGGAGVWAYDRAPAVDFTVPAPVRWVLPASLKRLDFAGGAVSLAQGRQKAAEARSASCATTLAGMSARSASALARAAHDVDAARAVAESYRKVQALRSYRPKGSDTCARLEDADRAVLEALQ